MDLAVALTAFGTIFVAELPDKTMLATVVLSARFARPLAVWAGSATALVSQMVIAVTAGRLLDLLPERPVRIGVALLFAVGAVLLWRSAGTAEIDEASVDDAEAADATRRTATTRRVFGTAAGVVFVAEWGDLTQLATASLASGGEAVSVFVGAASAMIAVAGIGAFAGRSLLRVLPERVLHRVAAVIFAVLAVVATIIAVGA